MANSKPHVGDINTELQVRITKADSISVNISSTSAKNIILRRPDLTEVEKAAIFTTDGIDGKITFITAVGDFSMKGCYFIQAYIVLPGWSGHSDIGEFEVFENLGT